MKELLAILLLLGVGCTTVRSPSVALDYLMRLKEPVVLESIVLPTHSGFCGLLLVDAEGKKAIVYRDYSSPEEKDTSGELFLGTFRGGRRVDYHGAEGTKLLLILDHLRPSPRLLELVRDFEASIRAKQKEPNQALEPTAPSGRGSS